MSETFIPTPGATQYFMEQVGTQLHVGICFRGNQYPDTKVILEGCRMLDALYTLEKAGYTVKIHRDRKGQAIKDQPTRIDFMLDRGQWTCKKYPKGWTASTVAIETKLMTEAEVGKALEWCKSHDWTVREFPGGARAWKGHMYPVRSKGAILALSRKIDDNIRREGADPRRHFDLAFDCFDI